ncbi:MAG: single-stranded-DNA-specific exonuclease RecJ [Lachnospiraceae bacterium]|nr:single-stranded-DNA-specific exonuclease RecJ [Lachnospiraceae bacterium]
MKIKKEKWVIKRRGGAMEDMVSRLGITPAFARILCGRGYDSAEKAAAFLYPDGAELKPAEALPDAERFCAFLFQAKERGQKVRVIGDYDADGVTATFIMTEGLKRFGIEADYRIPDRVSDGYGISIGMVEEAASDGIGVIVTVDNGIAAAEQVKRAKEKGLTVLVTDHHEPQEEIPAADAVVDFKVNPDYPGTPVSGAVVAAKLMDLLLGKCGQEGFLYEHMEILALSTVADVMELTGENRVIVKTGLAKPMDRWNLGLRSLAAANGLKTEPKAYSLGFVLAPCINALGRLKKADPGVALLAEQDEAEAMKLAESLVAANAVRKEMTTKAIEDACREIDARGDEEAMPIVYVSENCHESIAGIVAGKLRERYYVPAIVLCKSEDSPEYLKGSGRSIEEYNIFEGLQSCSKLLTKFGGHAQACGLTLPAESLDSFREAFTEHFRSLGEGGTEKIVIDLVMHFSDISEQFITEMGRMEPFGKGNARPVLASRNVTVKRISHFGRSVRYTRLQLTDECGSSISAVYFGSSDEFVKAMKERNGREAVDEAYAGRGRIPMHILYSAQKSSYSGEIELTVEHYQFPEGT